jgi:sugar lactone lactonase YvrE
VAVVAAMMSSPLAAPIVTGDVFISGFAPASFDPGNPTGHVRQFRLSGGSLGQLGTYATGDEPAPGGLASDAGGNLYVANFAGLMSASAGSVTRFAGADPASISSFGGGAGPLGGQRPVSVVIDASGNRYVGAAGPLGVGGGSLHRFDSTGAPTGSYALAPVNNSQGRGVDWIDLAADQQTIYYTSFDRHVYRYDLASGTMTASIFATLPDAGCGTGADACVAYEIKLLGDGGMLVADTNTIKRLDANGNVVQVYDDPATAQDSFVSIALDPDGASFWTIDLATNEILRFDIGTGAASAMGSAGDMIFIGGIGVAGEPRQALSTPAAAVPEPSAASLLALGLLALLRRRGTP